MTKEQKAFRVLWRELVAGQKRDLAKRCHTTVNYLSQIANGHRSMTFAMAAELEQTLPHLIKRGEVHRTCARCPWYNS